MKISTFWMFCLGAALAQNEDGKQEVGVDPDGKIKEVTVPFKDEDDLILEKHGVGRVEARALELWVISMFGTREKDFCWRRRYHNSFGKVMICGKNEEKIGGLCYARCPPGYYSYKGTPTRCYRRCPASTKDIGVSCRKPTAYGRGVGRPRYKCHRYYGEGNCEKHAGLWYQKCDPGFHNQGCCICSLNCPRGFKDDGAHCQKPWVRRPSLPDGRFEKPLYACQDGWELSGKICYPKCKEQYNMVASMCWARCPALHIGCGAGCALNRHECIKAIFEMIFAIVGFIVDVIGMIIPGGSSVLALAKTGIEEVKNLAVRIADKANEDQNSIDSMIEKATKELQDAMGKGIEGVCDVVAKFSESTEAGKLRKRIAQEKHEDVARIIVERASAELAAIALFGEDMPEETPDKWRITTVLDRIPKSSIRRASEEQAKKKGRICVRKFDKLTHAYDGVNAALTATGVGLDITSIAQGSANAVTEGIDHLGNFGDALGGIGLAVGAFEVFKAFDRGYCPENILPKSCQEVGDYVCGNGQCASGWMCRCNDGTMASYCPFTPKDLDAQIGTSKSEEELDDMRDHFRSQWKEPQN